MKKYLECGKIVSTHGVKGEVKVQHWCDEPEYLCGFDVLYMENGAKKLKVERARTHKDMVIIKLAGIDDMDSAAALRGKTLWLDRDDAPDDGSVFLQDLIGLEVKDADTGQSYGKLSDVIKTGANDVYEFTDDKGIKRLAPAIPEVVIKVDIDGGLMLIRPLRGLF